MKGEKAICYGRPNSLRIVGKILNSRRGKNEISRLIQIPYDSKPK